VTLVKVGDSMKKWLAVLFSLSLVLSGCGGGDDDGGMEVDTQEGQDSDVDVARAEEIYKNSACVNCHGGNLGGGAGPSLKNIGSRKSKAEILTIIHEGQGSMPGGMLAGEDAEIVAAWLASMK
jgi:cytochrome c551